MKWTALIIALLALEVGALRLIPVRMWEPYQERFYLFRVQHLRQDWPSLPALHLSLLWDLLPDTAKKYNYDRDGKLCPHPAKPCI